jgi:hypothetical protein
MPDPSSGLWRAVVRFATAIPPVPPQALSVFHAAVGAAILAGDSARFSGPSFAGARQIAGLFGVPEPRAWIAWGTLLVVVGVVMVFVWPWFEIHHPRLAVVTVLFGAAPMFFLVAGFVASLGLSAVASSSPVGAYGTIALFHLHTAVKMINAGAWDCRRPDGNPPPGSIETVLPHPLLYVWGLGLIGFWCGMIAAALWRDVLTGVLIERAACVIAVLATGAYTLGAVKVLGADVFTLPVLVTILYGPASLVRLVQITQDLRRAHRLLQARGCPPEG